MDRTHQEQHPDRLRGRPGTGHRRGYGLRPAPAAAEDAGRAHGGGEGGAGWYGDRVADGGMG